METKFPSTGSHRADWLIMLAIVIVLLVIFV
jgi:LPXTG-motif cell wall-anchored protein